MNETTEQQKSYEKDASKNNKRNDDIIVALIMLIISLAIQFWFIKRYDFNEIRTITVSSLAVFSISLAILSKDPSFANLNRLRTWLNETANVKNKILLLGITFAALLLIITYSQYHQYQFEAVEGKIKYILPDGNIKEIPTEETINVELQYLFPELSKIPFCGFWTYATNGNANSTFHQDVRDERTNYVRLKFKNNFNTTESNSGWMITPLQGYDARGFKYLSFWVEGEEGGERFGIGMKDLLGNEVKVDSGKYLGGERITTNWQEVLVKLEDFNNYGITSNLDVISLYSNGEMHYGLDSETIYVTDFKFKV